MAAGALVASRSAHRQPARSKGQPELLQGRCVDDAGDRQAGAALEFANDRLGQLPELAVFVQMRVQRVVAVQRLLQLQYLVSAVAALEDDVVGSWSRNDFGLGEDGVRECGLCLAQVEMA